MHDIFICKSPIYISLECCELKLWILCKELSDLQNQQWLNQKINLMFLQKWKELTCLVRRYSFCNRLLEQTCFHSHIVWMRRQHRYHTKYKKWNPLHRMHNVLSADKTPCCHLNAWCFKQYAAYDEVVLLLYLYDISQSVPFIRKSYHF